jgi:hypothetical protein
MRHHARMRSAASWVKHMGDPLSLGPPCVRSTQLLLLVAAVGLVLLTGPLSYGLAPPANAAGPIVNELQKWVMHPIHDMEGLVKGGRREGRPPTRTPWRVDWADGQQGEGCRW